MSKFQHAAALEIRLSLIIIVCFFVQPIAEARQSSTKLVIHHPDKTGALMARWKWALAEAEKQKFAQGFWIGYSIEREMSEEKHMITGEVWINDEQIIVRGIPLSDLLASQNPEQLRSTRLVLDDKKDKQLVREPIALLFEFSGGSSSPRLKRVGMSDMNMPVSLHHKPLLWLGPAEIKSSLELVRNLYAAEQDDKFECSLGEIIEVHGLLDK